MRDIVDDVKKKGAELTVIGNGTWKQAKEYCLQGTYQPTLLLYERLVLGDEANIPSIHGSFACAGC